MDRKNNERITAVWQYGGFWAQFKVGFVLAKSVFNRKLRRTFSQTSPSTGTLAAI
jgi:succinate-acetate transporter protein